MIVLGCEKIGYSIGATDILTDVTFSVQAGERVGLVGVNGAGKSTLIRIICGELADHTGRVFRAKGLTVGVLTQNACPDSDKSLMDELLEGSADLMRDERELERLRERIDAGESQLAGQWSALHERFLAHGGLEYRARAAAILANLGFTEDERQMPVGCFSGGQKTRVALAKVLSAMPDLLILDEPTNHLDARALAWLEDFLRAYPKTVLAVSHDRYFLDRVTTVTVEIEHGKSKVYGGNYSFFAKQKRRDREIQYKHYENQQKEIRRQQAYIQEQKRWGRERNLIAARSRQKALDRMQREERPEDLPEQIRLRFAQAVHGGNEVLTVSGLSKAYGDRRLFSGLDLTLRRGERLFVYGPNGSGKSTLLQILNGFVSADSGDFVLGSHVAVGYYDQENQRLDDSLTVADQLFRVDPSAPQGYVRGLLALFLFRGEDVYKPVSALSGGERARLTLAKLSMQPTNLLILDEPTNHLDIGTREVLEEALADYQGTVIAVSHDRYFVDRLATRILRLDGNGNALDFDGNYQEFLCYTETRPAQEAADGIAKKKAASEAKADYLAQKQAASEKRKAETRRARAGAEAERLEALIERLDAQTAKTDQSDYMELDRLYREKEQAENDLLAAYEALEE